MAKAFKNGVALHRLLESAPLGALESFLTGIDGGIFAPAFSSITWQESDNEDELLHIRTELLQTANSLDAEAAMSLDNHAQRILTLGEGRGTETINRICETLDDADRQIYSCQLDDLGRSLWLYLHQYRFFEEAENLFYANHYRNYGKMYEAFEIDLSSSSAIDFVWDETVKEEMETRLQRRLELTGRCTVSRLEIPPSEGNLPQHLLIVRHGGPLSSIAEFVEDNGGRKELYYRPLNEAMLLYSPDESMVEVFSASPGVRQSVAACFAEVVLKMDLSEKPLTLKQYNLSRFLTSLRLSVPEIEGFDIEKAAVVEAAVHPDNYKHKVSLKVTINDDIEQVAEELFGRDHIFKRAAGINRIVIAVRYTQDGERKSRTLNITLSEPNRCNLRSNRDPVQRELGYGLLSQWGILHPVRPLTSSEEAALFPILLQLFDQTDKDVPGQFFRERRVDPESLLEGGFIERHGRAGTLLVDEDGITHEVEVYSAGRRGFIAYDHPTDGFSVELPSNYVIRYAIRRDWLDEIVQKHLKMHLGSISLEKLDDHLTFLGDINLGADVVPCYLARNLKDINTLKRLDVLLRARSDKGIGLILSAGRDHPLCLGPNYVVAVGDYLPDSDTSSLDIDRLASAFVQGKQLAQGGMVVDLVKNGTNSATLYIPGKPPLMLVGEKQIGFIEHLVAGYQQGSPVVKTGKAMEGGDSHSPSAIFNKERWAEIKGNYVGPPPGKKRGAWMLLA
jgi:hypothetical protein